MRKLLVNLQQPSAKTQILLGLDHALTLDTPTQVLTLLRARRQIRTALADDGVAGNIDGLMDELLRVRPGNTGSER